VITIHSSSLAAQPIGFPQPNRTSNSNEPTSLPADAQNKYGQALPASTPEQIEAAISQTGLAKENNVFQETDRRLNKALQAYHQIRNQTIQVQLENNLDRVDYYA